MIPSPLLLLALTLGVYEAFVWLQRRGRHHPLLSPVAGTVVVVVIFLQLTGVSYAHYFGSVQFIHFLLGPSTVALAVPLFEQRHKIREAWMPLAGSLACGCASGILSAMAVARICGASSRVTISVAPKSVTTPIAMAISDKLGGLQSLTAVVVVITGIFGAVVLLPLLRAARIRSDRATGFALGMAAHGLGTARAFQQSNEMGAFAGLAIGLNGLLTALLVPWFVRLFHY